MTLLVRKLKVALFTYLLAIVGMNIVQPVPSVDGGLLMGLLVYPVYLLPLVFLYGILCSILVDQIVLSFKSHFVLASLFLHVFFGLLCPIVYGWLFESLALADLTFKDIFLNPIAILSMVLAVIFFTIDLILKRGPITVRTV